MRLPATYMLSILRIMAGLLFLEHGTSKVLGIPLDPMAHHVVFASLGGLAAILELVGGGLLTVGLFTRPTAFILSGEMAFAYFIAHFPHGFYPLLNKGEIAVLYCFVFLYFSVAGPGALSLDALVSRGKTKA